MKDCYQVRGFGWDVQFDYTVDGLVAAAELFKSRQDAGVIINPNRVEWSDERDGTDSGLTENEIYVLELLEVLCG